MKKNGFTLVELIAVIAILGILGVLVGPAILGIRNMVLKNSLDSKITSIESAAVEYASDNIMDIPSLKAKTIVLDEATNVTENVSLQDVVDCNKKCIEGSGTYILDRNASGTITDACPYEASKFNCRSECKIVSVKTLISRGYIAGDNADKDVLINPINELSLNESDVCITFDSSDALTRQIVTYVINKDNLY